MAAFAWMSTIWCVIFIHFAGIPICAGFAFISVHSLNFGQAFCKTWSMQKMQKMQKCKCKLLWKFSQFSNGSSSNLWHSFQCSSALQFSCQTAGNFHVKVLQLGFKCISAGVVFVENSFRHKSVKIKLFIACCTLVSFFSRTSAKIIYLH